MARPPLISDQEVLGTIAELQGRSAALTGTALRAELRRRFGKAGGVRRVYRLMRLAPAVPANPVSRVFGPMPNEPSDAEALRHELHLALERAELAEHREEHHQARWAREIHELREQVRALGDASRRLRVIEADLQDRSRELAAAYRRIADLEGRLEPR